MHFTVPLLFLLASAIGALFTLNALRPHRRYWPLVGPGFFASWLTTELAPQHIVWQAIATGLFLWAGALTGAMGWAALGIVAVSWVGLVYLFNESRRTGQIVEAALREALGEEYRKAIPPELGGSLDVTLGWRQRVFPLWMWDRKVERIRNIVFQKAEGVEVKLDVYRPRGAKGPLPTVLFVHGGAWMLSSKNDHGLALAYRFAAHGWAVVSTNYRLSPRFAFPAHIVDVKAAIRWIKEHGREYGADPDFIAVSGGSAGGHLAALAALSPNDPDYQPGFEGTDTKVQACVPFYGIYDFTDRKGIWKRSLLRRLLERYIMKRSFGEDPKAFDKASPISRVSADAPPFFVIHGTNDTLVPVEEARLFVETLRAVSRAPVAYAELPGAQHAFEVFPSERTGHALAAVERFLAFVYTEWRAARRQAAPRPDARIDSTAA